MIGLENEFVVVCLVYFFYSFWDEEYFLIYKYLRQLLLSFKEKENVYYEYWFGFIFSLWGVILLIF